MDSNKKRNIMLGIIMSTLLVLVFELGLMIYIKSEKTTESNSYDIATQQVDNSIP